MEQEFVASNGKVIANNQRLLITDFKFNFWKTAVGEIALPVIVLTLVIFSFANPNKAFSYLATVIYAILFFTSYFKQLYTALIRKSYSSYIPLSRIIRFEVKPDESGLETEVILHLKNDRYRSIAFRTLEKQYEGFIETLSVLTAHSQMARSF